MTNNNGESAFDRIERQQELNTQNIAVLIEGQTRLQNVQIEMAQTQSQLGQTQELIAQTLLELRAGSERQDRILDFLIRNNP